MNDLDLAAMLCSRLCHDLINPIGAVNNGIEVLSEEDDEAMRAQALELVSYSAGEAVRRLQFYRLAFGSSGGRSNSLALGDARKVAQGLLSSGRITLDWPESGLGQDAELNRTALRLLLNLVLVGVEALARGGTIGVRFEGTGAAADLIVTAEGDRAALNDVFLGALSGEVAPDGLDARTAQPFYSARLAKVLGAPIHCSTLPDRVELRVRMAGSAA
ncbi:MAG: histidine phosphotransferase [Proteobacteria bacterium]|nr:histidine phosphotransferase [Pseudomonadota bacterium]